MRITVREAARRLSCTEEFVRLGLQQGVLPIGTAVKMKRWVYLITSEKLENYMERGGNNGTET